MPESKTTDTVIASERSQKSLSRYGWAPTGRPRRPVLFVNPTSGGGKAVRAGVAERARERGIEVIVLSPGPERLAALGVLRPRAQVIRTPSAQQLRLQ
jgi:hypothetical protein